MQVSSGSSINDKTKAQFEKNLSQSNFEQVLKDIKGMNSQLDIGHFE